MSKVLRKVQDSQDQSMVSIRYKHSYPPMYQLRPRTRFCKTWGLKGPSLFVAHIGRDAHKVYTHWSVIEHRTRKQDIEPGKYRT